MNIPFFDQYKPAANVGVVQKKKKLQKEPQRKYM